MPWIRWIDEEDATGRLAEVYDIYRGEQGIDHILKIHALNPNSLDFHYRLYAHLMRGPSNLSRAEREMIGVAASRANDCFY